MLFLRQFKHLLPDAKAWRITIDKRLRQFFSGLTGLGEDVKTFYDLIFTDIDPQATRQLELWEQQFALPETNIIESQRRDRLDAAWKATGGQSPRYIQDTLRNAGFDVYVHEWWVPGSEAAVNVKACATARNPNDFLDIETGIIFYLTECGEPLAQCGEPIMEAGNFIEPLGYLLVNKLFVTTRDFLTLCGEPFMECGEPAAECGDFLTFINIPIVYPIPTDPAKWPYIVYIGGPTFPDPATINENRRGEFEDLALKIIPAQQWIGVLANYVPVSTVIANLLEAGDTVTGNIVKQQLSEQYNLLVQSLPATSYGSNDGTGFTPNTVFWIPPGTFTWTALVVNSINVVSSTQTTGLEHVQSEIVLTFPDFSATSIRLGLTTASGLSSYVSIATAGLNAYMAGEVGNSIPFVIDVYGDVTALQPNEHYFFSEQVSAGVRGFDADVTPQSPTPGLGQRGYLARMEMYDDPTRQITEIRMSSTGLFVINSNNEIGATGTALTFELEGFNTGSPITMNYSGVDWRVGSPSTDGLYAFLGANAGVLKKIKITGPA